MRGNYTDRPPATTEGDTYTADDVKETYTVEKGEWAVTSPPELLGWTELMTGFATRNTGWDDVPDFLVTFTAGERPVELTLDCEMSVSAGNQPARASMWLAGAQRQEITDFHPYADKWQPGHRVKLMPDLIPGWVYTLTVRLMSAAPTVWTRIDGNPGKPSTLIVESI